MAQKRVMVQGYHIGKDGPAPCTASVKKCPYSDTSPHFATMKEAEQYYEEVRESESDGMTLKKSSSTRSQPIDVTLSREQLQESVNKSKSNYTKICGVLNRRLDNTRDMYSRLESLNPYRDHDGEETVSYTAFKNLKSQFNAYRDRTAEFVEAVEASKYHTSPVLSLDDDSRIGNTVLVQSYDANTKEWLLNRVDSMGGSDIATLVDWDFTPEDQRTYYMRRSYERLVNSKSRVPTDEEMEKSLRLSIGASSGPLYRGTVWEDRIRDDFARDHKDSLVVYNAKGQYINPERPWHKVNFDGLTAPASDPHNVNGVLEIKTGSSAESWKNGVPNNYRGQVLSYLEATGFEQAKVRAFLNDHQSATFTLHRDDEVVPGCGVTMKQYLDTRVGPFFDEVKKNRH